MAAPVNTLSTATKLFFVIICSPEGPVPNLFEAREFNAELLPDAQLMATFLQQRGLITDVSPDQNFIVTYETLYHRRDQFMMRLGRFANIVRVPAGSHVVYYYVGHGKLRTGAWAMEDGQITYDDVIALWTASDTNKGINLTIIMDSCSSGSWVEELLIDTRLNGFKVAIQAACSSVMHLPNSNPVYNSGIARGGTFVPWWTQQQDAPDLGGQEPCFASKCPCMHTFSRRRLTNHVLV